MSQTETIAGPATTTQAPPKKRGAIIGTAPTWKLCPWHEMDLDVLGLNDGYVLGVPRANAWFDLHPIPEMAFRPKGERVVQADQVPVGAYLRPEGHLEWLKSRPFPVYLHDCHEAGCADLPKETRAHDPYPFPTWPNARPFPFKVLRAKYGDYVQSTPAWMLLWMMEQGYTETHIYGIHLATQWEYITQKPNMEFLIGMALARGMQFVIPEKSTLLKGKHVYALEPKSGLPLERVEQRIHSIKLQGQQLRQRLAAQPWYARGAAAELRRRLHVLNVELADARQEHQRVQALAQVA